MPRQNVVLTAEHLTRCFGRGEARVTAFEDLNVGIHREHWTTFLGPAGSGKTALFECLTGLAVSTAGRVTLHAGGHSKRRPVELSSLSDNARARLRRSRIGALPARCDLVGTLNLRDNILLGARLSHTRTDAVEFQTLTECLGLADSLRKRPDRLPVSIRQRARFARTLLTGPDVILADEPTAVLHEDEGTALLNLLDGLVARHQVTLVVFSSHDRVAEHGDHTIRLLDGRILPDAPHTSDTAPSAAVSAAFGPVGELGPGPAPAASAGAVPDISPAPEVASIRGTDLRVASAAAAVEEGHSRC